jgi:hypothetical protein
MSSQPGRGTVYLQCWELQFWAFPAYQISFALNFGFEAGFYEGPGPISDLSVLGIGSLDWEEVAGWGQDSSCSSSTLGSI